MWNACSGEARPLLSQCSSTGFYAALDNRFPPCSFCFICLMLPTRRIRGALVIWLAPRVEQHRLGRIACEPTKTFSYLALFAGIFYGVLCHHASRLERIERSSGPSSRSHAPVGQSLGRSMVTAGTGYQRESPRSITLSCPRLIRAAMTCAVPQWTFVQG